jgi:hypothetical protein
MSRPRKAQQQPSLSSGQASYVIDRMVAERRLSAGEILRYVSAMQTEIDTLERRLQSLRAAAGGGASPVMPARRGRPPGSGRARKRGRRPQQISDFTQPIDLSRDAKPIRGQRRRRRTTYSGEQLTSQQLQGRYLGLIRQIPASKRAQYQKTAKEKGREAAIKEMQTTLGK